MPNLEKESESDSVPADTGHPLSHNEMANLVEQRLESLRRAGLTHLPKGTGEYSFEPVQRSESQAENKTESRPESTKAAQPELPDNALAGPATKPSPSVVSESAPSYVADNRTSGLQETPDVTAVPSSLAAQSAPSASTPSASSKAAPPAEAMATESYGPSLPASERATALKVLQEEVARCTQCDELASTRSQTVFGVGNPSTRLVLLGEGPGADEDRIGEPFVGAAGQLLDKIISACSLSRSDVYILNTVKCRPPGNRNPSQSELANCWGYAERQLEILQPEFICCLGSVAARTLLKTTLSIGKLRRQLHSYRGSRVLVTYHPAYLLRTPSAKKHVCEDMQFLMKEMGIELSK